MSVVAYTGLPGSGKSYGVVENVIVPALGEGREVYTNIPLRMDVVEERYPGCRVTVFDVSEMRENPSWCLQTVPPGVIFVLDEVWRVWPAGLKSNVVDEAYKSFLAEHRHYVSADGFSTQIVLVTQDLSQTAAFCRELVEKTLICKKLDGIGASSRYRVDIYDGAIKGQRGPKDRVLNKQFGKYKAEVFSLYQSHTHSDTGIAGFEGKTDKRGSVLKSGVIKYGLPFAVILFGFGFYNAWGFFNPASDVGDVVAATPEQKRDPTRSTAAALKTPSAPSFSDTWRLGGFIDGGKLSFALIVSPDGRSRMIGMQHCDRFPDTGMLYCMIAGEYVTEWSGAPPSGIASGFSHAS